MGTITVVENVTLDGVMQAPGRPDEDRRGGFAHGGWAQAYQDEVLARVMGEGMARSMSGNGALLFGRKTYQDFAAFWPHQTDNPFTPVLDATRKYVVSRTLREPLPWQNSTLLTGARPGHRAATVRRPRLTEPAAARRQRPDDHRRGDRDLPARPARGLNPRGTRR